MGKSVRDEILDRLETAPRGEVPVRPAMPPFHELSMNTESLIGRFTEKLMAQTGVVHRVKDSAELLDKIYEILKEEGIKRAMASTDEVLAPLDLPGWGRSLGISIVTPLDFRDRDSFKEAVFNQVEAGITSADYAVAESGTLAIVHTRDKARLVSLAPILHIAVAPVDRVVPVYENVIDEVYGQGRRPGQLSLITGPSMTADIQATPFKGMHGPRRLIVIIVG